MRGTTVSAYERLFGRPSGTHTHPVTHPLWMKFLTGNCVVCGNAKPAGGA